MPRGGKRPGAGWPRAFNEQQMFAILNQCECRLMKRYEQGREVQAKKLFHRRANQQYSKDRSADARNDPVHQERTPGVDTARLAQSLNDETFVSEYEMHLEAPEVIKFSAKRDVERLLLAGKSKEEQRETHLRHALAHHMQLFRRAVVDTAAGQDVYVPDVLDDAVHDAAQALGQRRRLLNDMGLLQGPPVMIPSRRLKAPKGGSVRGSIIAEVAQKSRSLFGRKFTERAVREAWRAGNKTLDRLEAELRLAEPDADPKV